MQHPPYQALLISLLKFVHVQRHTQGTKKQDVALQAYRALTSCPTFRIPGMEMALMIVLRQM